MFALQKGELVVAQTAIIGSIFANALLVLGLVIVVGARRAPDGLMRFSRRLPNDTATLLQVTVFIIVLVGLSLAAHDPASHHVQAISAVGSVCVLIVYVAWVVPYLRSDSLPGAGRRGGDGRAGARRRAAARCGAAAAHAAAPDAHDGADPAAARRGGVGVRVGLVHQRSGAGDRGAEHLAGVRRSRDRGDRRQRRRERTGPGARARRADPTWRSRSSKTRSRRSRRSCSRCSC